MSLSFELSPGQGPPVYRSVTAESIGAKHEATSRIAQKETALYNLAAVQPLVISLGRAFFA